MFTPNEFQVQLFAQIFGSTKGKSKITQDLMGILGCSRASLYRKRTGSTPLTADELVKLANHFSLSIDALRTNSEENAQIVVCTTMPPIKQYSDIDFYLENTRRNLEIAVQQPDAQLYFTAKELPLYRYMNQPTLSAFRYYLWIMENIRRHQRFDPVEVPSELIQKGADLTKLSQGIKTTEFWTASAFDNLIGQISYTQASGRISDRILAQLKLELLQVVDELAENIISEKSSAGAPYQLFVGQDLTFIEGALIEIGPNYSEVLFSYGSINYMKSTNPNLVNAFKHGLRYHNREGQTRGSLDRDIVESLTEPIRAKINAL